MLPLAEISGEMPTWLQWTTFALGLIGTVLGVWLGIKQVYDARVRLRVRVYQLHIFRTDVQTDSYGCVEVANLGAFPVTIKGVSFKPRGRMAGRLSMTGAQLSNGERLPVRVEPRDSVQILFNPLASFETMTNQSVAALVETACGHLHREKLGPSGRTE